jgi:hypothetical protein
MDIATQMAKMRQPVSRRLELANSLIDGTNVQEKIISWRKRFTSKGVKFSHLTGRESLGAGYWHGFIKRHGHQISARKGVKFERNCAEWCTYQNFTLMYDEVYKLMFEAGIAIKLDNSVWLNKAGGIWAENLLPANSFQQAAVCG